ncbi:ABC transporter permease [Sediminicoccus sp. BL-A-41-H5]|uniref:ABC transporter permease n=1 Tax=Sediminicoccus sp. BL-A-41-H5 TaxID=3421106 RepID=UPI003D670EA0
MPDASAAISSAAPSQPEKGRPGSARRARQIRQALRPVVVPTLAVIALFVVWEFVVKAFGIPEYILPAPTAIYAATMDAREVMLGHTLSTLTTIMLGFILSIVVSLPLAVLVTASPNIAHAVYPILVLIQSIPKVALAPILVLALGAGEASRVTVTFLVAFFPLVISTATGLLAAPPELIELSRSLRASRFQQLFLVRLPYSVPFVFSGLKLAMTFSVVGAVVGEFVAADQGLGYQIMSATAFFRTSLAFGALLILSFLGIVLFQAVVVVERVFFPWAAQEEKA